MSLVGPTRRSRARTIVVLAAVAALAVPHGAVGARPTLDELRQERREAEQQHAGEAAELQAAERELEELQGAFARAVDEYNQATEQLAAVEERIALLEGRVTALADALSDRRERVGTLVRGMYQRGASASTITSLLAAGGPLETVQRYSYLRGAQRSQRILLEGYAAERQVLAREQADLDRARARQARIVADLDERRADLEQRAEEQGEQIARLEARVDRARTRLGQAQAAERSEQQRIADERAREREREREQLARASRSTSSSNSTPASAQPARAQPASTASAGAPTAAAQTAINAAMGQIGTRYRWGGTSPSTGFDCSGLIVWAYAQAGVRIPYRSTSAQFANLPSVPRSEIQPGDLLYFRHPVGHAGIYIGNGQMVEAPYSGKSVRVRSINRSDFRGARRPTG